MFNEVSAHNFFWGSNDLESTIDILEHPENLEKLTEDLKGFFTKNLNLNGLEIVLVFEKSENEISIAIFDQKSKKQIGLLSGDIKMSNNNILEISISIVINSNYKRRGIGTQVIKELAYYLNCKFENQKILLKLTSVTRESKNFAEKAEDEIKKFLKDHYHLIEIEFSRH